MADRAINALAAIPFGHLIGSPLKAAIEAQGLAAASTLKFIREAGLETKQKEAGLIEGDKSASEVKYKTTNVTFTYSKQAEE